MNKTQDGIIETEGTVTELHPNAVFKIKLDIGNELLGHLCGKMRKRYIKLTVGDRVKVEISQYDPTLCRITYRISGTSIVRKARPYKKR